MLRSKSISFLFALAVPFAVAFSPALASADPPPADAPAEAPEAARTTINAAFQRYVLAPSGRPMGLLLDGGTFVRTPHHALNREAPQLKAGDTVEVEGVALKTATGMHMARAVVKQNGVVIADASQLREHHDRGHEDHAAWRQKHHVELSDMSGAGKVQSLISTPKGRILAVILEDGTTAVGRDLASLGLKVGDQVSFEGKGGTYTQGKALRIHTITMPDGQTRELPRRAPRAPESNQTPA
jgi:hypothetical protein